METDKNVLDVQLNRNNIVFQTMYVRLRKPLCETKILQFILTLSYVIYSYTKLGVKFFPKNLPFNF